MNLGSLKFFLTRFQKYSIFIYLLPIIKNAKKIPKLQRGGGNTHPMLNIQH